MAIDFKSSTYLKTVFGVTLVVGGLSALHVYINGTDEIAIRLLIRWTARISAFLFALAFGAASFQYFLKNPLTDWLLKYRPHLGLAFGVTHTFHLIFLIWLQNSIHPVFTLAKKTSLLGGGLAYVFMYLMVLTTFPYFKNKLNTTQWKLLHLIGGYWIWIIFFRSYTRQIFYQERGYLLWGLLLGVLIFRVLRRLSQRKKRLIRTSLHN